MKTTQTAIDKQINQYQAKPRKNSKKKFRKPRDISWNVFEQIVYVQFLKKNSHTMKTTESRKKHKVFKALSDEIGTRTSIQVKSHHQKLQQKYHTIYNIIIGLGVTIKRRLIQLQVPKKADLLQDLADFPSLKQPNCPSQNENAEGILFQTFQDPIFEQISQNYDPISACFAFDQNEPLI